MAQFRGTITGSRDKTTSRLGHKTTGLTTTCNGWNIGVTYRAVYDEKLGKNIKRPFLHVRYRSSAADDRR